MFTLYCCSHLYQSGQDDDEDDVAVDDLDYLNEDELAELQRDEENIRKEVKKCFTSRVHDCWLLRGIYFYTALYPLPTCPTPLSADPLAVSWVLGSRSAVISAITALTTPLPSPGLLLVPSSAD